MASRANSFLLSHIVNGRILFPASGYVTLAWKTFAESLGRDFESLPVAIEKLKLIKSSVLSKNDSIIFTISIMKSGEFEISDQTDVVASGRIRVFKVIKHEFSNNPNCIPTKLCTDLKLNADDIYTDFYIRGSQYGNNFRSIKEIDYNCKTAMVKWSKNWITFLDSIFQSMALFENSTLAIPEQVSNIVINPAVFKVKVKQLSLNYSNFQKCIYRDGVKVNNVRWSKVPIKRESRKYLKKTT
ncbi:hypothetical protein NQ317_008473 [Molorchus minor]|uniref:PKS/mFAS DH domain-containing protein n=1 Tax=Molorchus minor TaxID=1323400 RepID=A0ABQ9JEX0_9CUCU|nr:hypothetical protein NQ317_008473 [Molorchus minor]